MHMRYSEAVRDAQELTALELELLSSSLPVRSVAEEAHRRYHEVDESCELALPSWRHSS